MSITSIHEDRTRSQKSFRTSLLIGVIAGGTGGAAVEILVESTLDKQVGLEMIMPSIILLALISAILVIIGLRVSETIETRTEVYEIHQSSRSISILLEGAKDECPPNSKLEHLLDEYLEIVQSETSFLITTIELVRKLSKRVTESLPENPTDSLDSHVKAICQYPNDLYELFNNLKKEMESSKVFEEKQWTAKWKRKILLIQKEKFVSKKWMIKILLENNLQNSIAIPFKCYVFVNPSITIDEYALCRGALDILFTEILNSDSTVGYGLKAFNPEEDFLIHALQKEVKRPIMERFDEIEAKMV